MRVFSIEMLRCRDGAHAMVRPKELIRFWFGFWFGFWVLQRVSGARLWGELDHDWVGEDEGDAEEADRATMGRVAQATVTPLQENHGV